MENKISKHRSPVLATILMGATLAGLCTGCKLHEQTQISKEKEQLEFLERNNDYLEGKIRKIAIYQRFNDGRYGVNYKTFTDLAGIPRELGEEANDLRVWVEVWKTGTSIKQRIVKPTKNGKGYVRLDVPYEKAQDIYSALAQYMDKELGIERLPADFWKEVPSGDY